jgi:branched-chain amino acid aminotransferase
MGSEALVAYVNGAYVPRDQARVSVFDVGFLRGDAVFDTTSAWNGRIFKLTEHTQRLVSGAETLDFTIPYSVEEIDAACNEVIQRQGFKDAYVRPVAWRGSEMMGVSARTTRIHLAIAAWEWATYFTPEARMEGIRMMWSKWRRPDPATIPCQTKASGLYMICTLSKHAAESQGCNDALMLDYRGFIAEATGANIFLVIDGKIHTPVPDCFLDGITRRTVIELARMRGLEVIERHIMPEELDKASEVFLCGTAVEVTPVREIGERRFTPGQITRRLLEDYDEEVRRELPRTLNAPKAYAA